MINQKDWFFDRKYNLYLVVSLSGCIPSKKKSLIKYIYIYSNEWKLLIWRQSASMKNEVIIKIAEWLHDDALFLD